MSAVMRALRSALDDPKDWSLKKYMLVHQKSGVCLWIGNGSFFLDVSDLYGETLGVIGFFERHILWVKVYPIIRGIKKSKKLASEQMIVDRLCGHISE